MRDALGTALRDFYGQSWRLLALNAAVGVALLAVVLVASVSLAGLALVALVGPLLAALVHCEVGLVRTEELRLGCALDGLRLLWRRGLALACAGGAVTGLGVLAVAFYARGRSTIPLAFLVGYVLALLCVVQLFAWPLAVAEPERSLLDALKTAVRAVLRRPGASTGLALALLLVNLAGIAVAVMPFLTLTIAYTFLAATRFVLPREEVTA
ncbi:MAG TPA: hypothetical protein VLN26_16760 [Gaiellaceae bacterium]|nr:hypothetical protein [Gaiellaceae bacterium]